MQGRDGGWTLDTGGGYVECRLSAQGWGGSVAVFGAAGG
jgi:hypothetical protein